MKVECDDGTLDLPLSLINFKSFNASWRTWKRSFYLLCHCWSFLSGWKFLSTSVCSRRSSKLHLNRLFDSERRTGLNSSFILSFRLFLCDWMRFISACGRWRGRTRRRRRRRREGSSRGDERGLSLFTLLVFLLSAGWDASSNGPEWSTWHYLSPPGYLTPCSPILPPSPFISISVRYLPRLQAPVTFSRRRPNAGEPSRPRTPQQRSRKMCCCWSAEAHLLNPPLPTDGFWQEFWCQKTVQNQIFSQKCLKKLGL